MKWQDLLALSLIGASALADSSQASDAECHSPACLTSRSIKSSDARTGRGAAHASGTGDNVVTDSDVTQNGAYAHGQASGKDASASAHAEMNFGASDGDVLPNDQMEAQGACQNAACNLVKLEKHANPPVSGSPGSVSSNDSGSPSGCRTGRQADSLDGHESGPQSGLLGDNQSEPQFGSPNGQKNDAQSNRGQQSRDPLSGGRQGNVDASVNMLPVNSAFNQFAGGACISGLCLLSEIKLGGEMQLILNSWKAPKFEVVGQAQNSVPVIKSNYITSPAEIKYRVMSDLQCAYGPAVNVFSGSAMNTSFSIAASAMASLSSGQGPIEIFTPLVNSAEHGFQSKPADIKLPPGTNNGNAPIATNKFHTNMIVGALNHLSFTGAYGVAFANGKSPEKTEKKTLVGLSLQHFPKEKQLPDAKRSAVYNFPDALEMVIGAQELNGATAAYKTSAIRSMSLLATIAADEKNYIEFPIVQGMGFVTAIYHGGLTPKISSKNQITTLEKVSVTRGDVQKYKATLNTKVLFLIYATRPHNGAAKQPVRLENRGTGDLLSLSSTTNEIIANGPLDGLVLQIAKTPEDTNSQSFYDASAGSYVTTATVLGSATPGEQASYKIDYNVAGFGKTPLIFAMPHMMTCLDQATKARVTNIQMSSGIEGEMTGVMSYSLVMNEKFAQNLLFGPWANGMERTDYTPGQVSEIAKALETDLALEVTKAVKDESNTYFAAKVLSRHAFVLATADLIGIKQIDLTKMKEALNIFITNKQKFPIHYDTVCKGIVPAKPKFADAKDDVEYGSWRYANHNYHYGYLVHAAAVVGYLDSKKGGSWLQQNMHYFNTLVRDVMTPVENDPEFPFSRSFDWFAGHSWATGAREDPDGQVQSSAGEDVHFAYAMKLWGGVTKDVAMEARGDLMLAVLARSLNQYHFFSSDAAASGYGKYKVAGLMYHNKLAYETFFGNKPEFIHGVHMLPISPATAFVRSKEFAQAEWNLLIAPVIAKADTKWKTILKLNSALFDPSQAYKYFKDIVWKADEHDQGQSKTWGLAYTGALMSWNNNLGSGSDKLDTGSTQTGASPQMDSQDESSMPESDARVGSENFANGASQKGSQGAQPQSPGDAKTSAAKQASSPLKKV